MKPVDTAKLQKTLDKKRAQTNAAPPHRCPAIFRSGK